MQQHSWRHWIAVALSTLAPVALLAAPLRILPLTVTGYTGTETLTDFPVLVRLSEQIEGFSYADCAPDGADVSFTLEDGTALAREIDTWDPHGESLIWVRIPALTKNLAFECRYDDSAVTAQPASQSDGSVWKPSGYIGVWHMDEVDAKDSTGLGADGTGKGNQTTDGAIGPGQLFDGHSKIDCGAGPAAAFDKGFSVECWVRPDLFGGDRVFVWKGGCFSAKMSSASQLRFTTLGLTHHDIGGADLVQGEWSHLVYTFLPGQADGFHLYKDGALLGQKQSSAIKTPPADSKLFLGATSGDDQNLTGVLDEIRISKVIRSDDWILGCHETMSSPSFISFGNVLFMGSDALQISAEPFEIGVVTPSYGLHLEYPAGTVVVCSAPSTVTNEAKGFTARCTGWRLHDSEGTVVASGLGTNCSYTQDGGYGRLVWLFEISYRMEGTAEGGTVTGFEHWAPSGSMQSFLAEPADPTMVFRRWEGDVPAGRENDNPLEVVVDKPTSVKAVFTPRQTRKWTGAGDDALASNGANWEGGVAPVAGDDVLLDATGTAHPMTWDLDLPVNTWTQEGYTNIVTIATRYGAEGFTNLVIQGDCILKSGVWTHMDNSRTEEYRLRATIGGNLSIGSAALVSADALGYDTGRRPTGLGNVPISTGGAYGGYPGSLQGSYPYQPLYGNPLAPENLGAGGGWIEGAGAIRLDIAGRLSHDGVISADSYSYSRNSSYKGHYSGSGGSVYIHAASIEGEGTITACAGNVNAAGSGGRIAVILTGTDSDFSLFDVVKQISAQGGDAGNNSFGASGTIYAETKKDGPGHGWLVMKGNPKESNFPDGTVMQFLAEDGTLALSRITLTNGAVVRLPEGAVLDVASTRLESVDRPGVVNAISLDGGRITASPDKPFISGAGLIVSEKENFLLDAPSIVFSEGGFLDIRDAITWPRDLTFKTNSLLLLSAPFSVGGSMFLDSGAHGHGIGPFKENPVPFDLSVAGDLILEEGAEIEMDGLGFELMCGPSHGIQQAGGSYGGTAGSPPRNAVAVTGPYGSIRNPVDAGSGGAHTAGGGAILLKVGGELALDGAIWSRSKLDPQFCYYVGAGGSINVTAGSIRGKGRIGADGADGVNYGGGGGGRVAVTLTGPDATFAPFTGLITALGSRSNSKPYGGAGTVYLREGGQAIDEGRLVISNGDSPDSAETKISTGILDAKVGDVEITGGAVLAIGEDAVLSVSGDFTNGATFLSGARSSVDFAGQGGSTISGDSIFSTLSSSAPGKTIRFAAGSTQSVTGLLSLAGSEDAKLAMRSTEDGAAWKLAVTGPMSVMDVDVADSDASSGASVVAINSIDSGANANWTFTTVVPGETVIWTGAESASWNDAGNWSPARIPLKTDLVKIPSGVARSPGLGVATEIAGLEIGAGSSLALSGRDLDVKGETVANGTFIASATETITFRGNVSLAAFSAANSTIVLAGSERQSFRAPGVALGALRDENAIGIDFVSSFSAADFTSVISSDHDLAFAPGITVTAGKLTLRGDPPTASLLLHSSIPGQRWKIGASVYDVSGVTVRDSDATAGVEIYPKNSVDGGNNLGWRFSDTRKRWTGAVDGDFLNGANWADGKAPSAEDDLYIVSQTPVTIATESAIGGLTVGGATRLVIDAPLSVAHNVIVERDGVLVWNKPGAIGGNLVLTPGATMTHDTNGTTFENGIELTVHGSGYIAPDAVVDVTGKGFARQKGPGYNGNTGSSHGGRGGYGTNPTAACYGSIVAPTNCGSGGNWGDTPGGGVVVLAFGGPLAFDGAILANGIGVDPNSSYKGHYNGTGGSVNLTSAALTGAGRVEAVGGCYDSNGAFSGGGRIAVKVTGATADFSAFQGAFAAYGGHRPDGSQGASSGTIYTEVASRGAGTGQVLVDGGPSCFVRTDRIMTDFPSTRLCEEGETEKTTLVVTGAATLNLMADTTVEDIVLDGAKPVLRLNGHTLTVRSKPHALGVDEQKQVTYADGGQIVWVPHGGPTLLLIR